jgi:cell division protein FtsQ
MLTLCIIALLGFVEHERNVMSCKSIEITIDNSNEMYFVDEQDILDIVKLNGDSVIGQEMGSIDVSKLEKIINRHPSVENAHVYKTIDGIIKFEIKQRTPLMRIFSMSGESYYIDKLGYFMPLSDKYTARVIIANGYIFEKFAPNASVTILDILQNDSIASKTVIDDIFLVSEYISADEFWNAQIDQIYVNIDRDIELIPRVGNHTIVFGNAEQIEEKFNKLMLFYKKAMPGVGWNEYKYINLKYKDQIICSK